jgi:hypothetical protein
MLPLLEVLLAFYPLSRSGLATPVPGSLSYLIAESSGTVFHVEQGGALGV